ncbi:molybdopterin binding oxidoreductase [Aureobasidium sp. EXF-12298]|nr:molybdopterin binding oxidoreductase [Aureobasidium sp. EXF-12298]KAI4757398.1 molybdopterin binding oxidoreductase [Aureobasidium sp. EXF-12344]KAI4777544.1 molybdopterin binding oxidoreductase [Aureobasidium sp. EXF-3400]
MTAVATGPTQQGSGKLDDFKVSGEAPYYAEEREGWKGYIEWEAQKKKHAEEILRNYKFPPPPEFQLVPLPDTNPILEGVRWKQYHYALGETLKDIPDISWKYVKQEKSEDMIHVLQFPYNGEPPRDRLVETEITDNKDHFIRNHGGVPEVDPEHYTLEIEGLVNDPKTLTLADLQNEELFPRQSNVVSLQCSGTRRIEQIAEYPGDGDELINAPWGEGAIGTARWTGVSLKKVIKYCGGLKDGGEGVHLEFYGADTYFKKGKVYNYVVSVPWRKVKINEVLLAWEMNGEPLPKIHGFPLRAVVFGYIGARSCKWIYKIKAIRGPSLAPVQAKEYLYYTPQIGKQNAMYSNGFSIQDMPVSSAIMTPVNMAQIVHDGKIKMRGWAYSGGGHWPVRVEVSGDGGSIWYEVPYENMTTKYYYAWRLWEIDLPVDAEGWLELCVRTWDNAMNTQPTYVRSAWNWDLHVTSSCINKSRPLTAARLKLLKEKNVPIVPITHPMEFDLESEDHYMEEMRKQGGREPEE